jgi:iron complex outermembrane receptor protein
MHNNSMSRLRLAVLAALLVPTASLAQSNQIPSITLPPVIVTAQKEPADVKAVPASITVVTADTIANAGLRVVTDAAVLAPNTIFTEFTARKVSNARFRGIGSSPANPAITTYLDGVPQLNSNSSNIELLDVAQIEFVRGPQSPLFGRNTLGGIVNVTSTRPSTKEWTGSVIAPFGDYGAKEVRGNVSGPLGDQAAMSVAVGKQAREGFTVNQVTGHDLDFRDGTFAKAQLLLTPNANWQARVIYAHESNRDGDYALGDLTAIRATPFVVARDFEGFTNRDINATTVNVRGMGERVSIESTTGFVKWRTEDETDLDYSPLPLATRRNAEGDFQFTQEVRFASPANAPRQLSETMMLKWQGGVAFFNQNYDQLAVNTLSPFVLSPYIPFAVAQTSPESAIDSSGIGLFGHGTLSFHEKTDLTVGLRFDYEQSDAVLNTFYTPAIAPANRVAAENSFSDVSPQFAMAYRPVADTTIYGSLSRGFKAGGFNPAALPGSEAYDAEHAWHVEGGVKSTFAGGKASASAAVFQITWDDMQLNVPNPFVPGQFYIANVGRARSRGLELDLTARPHQAIDVFATFGFTSAAFRPGTMAAGVDVGDNKLPYTPTYTALIGTQVTRAITPAITLYGRGEAALNGPFEYDEANTARQAAYGLANFRVGARGKRLFAEAWIRNAFDTLYVPVAIPYSFAPSGFIGENGRPRTFGVSAGVTF